jgi:hypothetical protein
MPALPKTRNGKAFHRLKAGHLCLVVRTNFGFRYIKKTQSIPINWIEYPIKDMPPQVWERRIAKLQIKMMCGRPGINGLLYCSTYSKVSDVG